jgi:hypothetical protein
MMRNVANTDSQSHSRAYYTRYRGSRVARDLNSLSGFMEAAVLKKSIMLALAGISMLGALPAVAQGMGHTWFMRGSVVGADKGGKIVCVGKADGATVGQVLTVYRVDYQPGQTKGAARRQKMGHVRIDHLFDDHFAHVSVVDGRADKNDIVELSRRH